MATSVVGTTPELAVYGALVRLGFKPGEDFEFQSAQFGGREIKGGLVADFRLYLPRIIINVQSQYWHYGNSGRMAQDRLQQLALESAGWHVVYIDEEDALRDVMYYVREALAGRDHSRMTRG